MALEKGHWVSVVVGVGVVVLTAVINIGIREWYQPDIRYEEGSWYKSGQLAITSLRLENVGHSDAESIRVTASFPEALADIATSDPGLSFRVIAGGLGQKMVTGSVERIVPGEAVDVYFAVTAPALLPRRGAVVSSVVFNGGQGGTGQPLSSFWTGAVLSLLAVTFISFTVTIWIWPFRRG
jgi:hypothetical protein